MKYLVAIYRPHGFEESHASDPAMGRDIDELNDAMVEAGVRMFVGGLRAPELAKTVRRDPAGETVVLGEPIVQAAEFMNGFWVLEVASEDDAVEWGRRAANACRGSVEVRAFH